MVITVSASQPAGRLRPIHPNKDFPQLVELLQMVFGKEFEGEGGQVFNNLGRPLNPSVLWRFDPMVAKLAPGFLWEVNGRIVGNVTIIYTRSRWRYLVANVAVHPDFRRQGIARHLMQAAIKDVNRRGGREIALQVVHGNQAAVELYESMDFIPIGSMTTWQSSVSRVRFTGDNSSGKLDLRPLPQKRWLEAYELDKAALNPDLCWPEPLTRETYQKGIMRRFSDFLNGRKFETWVVVGMENQFQGLASISSEWARAHQLSIRIHPHWQGKLERILLDGLIQQVKSLPRRNINLIHPANDELMNLYLPIANFRRQRTLTHMRLDIKDA